MKSFEKDKKVKPCKCGSTEFITEPNRYDVCEVVDGKLELIKTLSVDEESKLFCRECSEEISFM